MRDLREANPPDASSASPSRPTRLLFCRHGILINRWFLKPLECYFSWHGFRVFNRSYPTTRKSVEDHARDLWEEVTAETRGLEPGSYEIYFLTHSLGGLVLRYALTHHPFPPLRRAVLLVPPNNGASQARHHREDPLFRWLFGPRAGRQLAEEPPGIFERCGRPEGIELGVIAGTASPAMLFPAPIERPHDGVVALEEARLEGYPCRPMRTAHTPCLFHPAVWREARHFLETGSFTEPDPTGCA